MDHTNIIIKMTADKKTCKIEILPIISIVFIILLANFISAFSIGGAYYKEKPLEISAGQTKDIELSLQDMGSSEEINAQISITKGSEILELIDSSNKYTVPVGGEAIANLRVTIPSDAKIGDTYPVEITFTTITEAGSGEFGFGSSIGREFDVIVIPTTEQAAKLERKEQIIQWAIYLAIGIIILIAIIFFIIKKKAKKKK